LLKHDCELTVKNNPEDTDKAGDGATDAEVEEDESMVIEETGGVSMQED
jgi:hypothetical protein